MPAFSDADGRSSEDQSPWGCSDGANGGPGGPGRAEADAGAGARADPDALPAPRLEDLPAGQQ
eukprot:13694771-Alexandrium_andersonii.AAC.1